MLSYQAAMALADGSLKEILKGSDSAEIPVSILHREDRLAQTKVQAFVAFAAAALRGRIAALDAKPAESEAAAEARDASAWQPATTNLMRCSVSGSSCSWWSSRCWATPTEADTSRDRARAPCPSFRLAATAM